jgi:hypothetical protein
MVMIFMLLIVTREQHHHHGSQRQTTPMVASLCNSKAFIHGTMSLFEV